MLYSALILTLRSELKDFGRIHQETIDGDASTLNFILKNTPVKDASYVVKIGGVTKTETTDYTIDKDTGVLTFVSAPASGSDNVSVSYQSVKIRDADYIQLINDGIDHFRWKFWKETDNSTTITTVRNQYEYDLSTLTGILYVLNVWYKSSSAATDWNSVQAFTNWKWLARQTKLYTDPPFDTSSLPIKIRYLKSFTKGTATTATVDIPDEILLPFKYYIYARFYERIIPEKISETAAVTTFPSFAPVQVVYDISQKYYNLADNVANRLAYKLPPMTIKSIIEG